VSASSIAPRRGIAKAGGTWQIAPVRILGLDVGSRRIGVAISDELGLCAHPLEVLARRGTPRDVAAIAALCAKLGVARVVVGIPTEPDGNEGSLTQASSTPEPALQCWIS